MNGLREISAFLLYQSCQLFALTFISYSCCSSFILLINESRAKVETTRYQAALERQGVTTLSEACTRVVAHSASSVQSRLGRMSARWLQCL